MNTIQHIYCVDHDHWHVKSRSRAWLRFRVRLHNLWHGPLK